MNKAARAALAKETINKQIPSILSSNPRAKSGVHRSRRLLGNVDLPKLPAGAGKPDHTITITIRPLDTLEAARAIHDEDSKAHIAVLNMASPLQPGGGVVRGAKAQEESLCMRSTLYPSLRPEWYRHKPDTVIYTPDVLVFKSPSPELNLLDPKDQIYVDVISCAAPRHPEIKQLPDGTVKYEDPRDEEAMALKIKYIMRTAVKTSATHVVLGAIGCGAYRNPIKEVAGMMRRCLLGRGQGRPLDEDWAAAGIKSVVFAILDESPKQEVWDGFVAEFSGHENVVIEEKN